MIGIMANAELESIIMEIAVNVGFNTFLFWFILIWVTKDGSHNFNEIWLWNTIVVLLAALFNISFSVTDLKILIVSLAILTLIIAFTMFYFVLDWRFYVHKPSDRLKILGVYISIKGKFSLIWILLQ